MTHKGFMVYRKGIHAKGVFVTFVVVGVVAVFESGIVVDFYLVDLRGLSEEKLIFLLGLDKCLLEQVGVW
jgi:hypothetical protein